jgi:SAM-dependent methyltransferase
MLPEEIVAATPLECGSSPSFAGEDSAMVDLSAENPTGRFSGLAETYARHRPAYPDTALDFILWHCGLGQAAVAIDVGSGTGISSRQLAARGLKVIGIEPNADMRRQAEAAPVPPGTTPPEYRDGRAEATGLAAGSAALVLAAQAFHWFESQTALAEFHRILKPGGWVALLWNERDESDSFTAAYGPLIRATSEAAELEVARGRASDALLAAPSFTAGRREKFINEQSLDEEGLLGRAFSTSYAPRDPASAAKLADDLRALFGRSQINGLVTMRYRTTVTVAQRA